MMAAKQRKYTAQFKAKDEKLAEVAAEIETMSDLSATESRDRIKAAISQRYTLPA